MPMKHYLLKQLQQDSGILYVTLEPRQQRDHLHFYPGQYAAIGFSTPNGRRSPMRCFSITSSPQQPGTLQFAIRVIGRFTRTLSELPLGTEIFVQGPFGEFVIDKRYDRNVVLLAGGIGITPFMSMIRTLSITNDPLPVTLLYSYRSHHHIPFHGELREHQQHNPHLRVATFVTDTAAPPNLPHLLSGKMNEQHIKQVVGGEYAQSTYFLCGPSGFMDSTARMLRAHGVEEERILTESFTQSSGIIATNGLSVQKMTYAFATAVLLVGIIGISYLDLSRYVPRVQAATTTGQSVSKHASSSTSSNSSNTNSSSTASSDTSSTSNQSNTSTTQSYQPPVTSVS